MPKKILAARSSPKHLMTDILGKGLARRFSNLLHSLRFRSRDTLQMRIEKEWITVNFNNTDIQLKKKGAVLDVTLAYDIDYRMLSRQMPGRRGLYQ